MDAACDGDGILLRTSFMRCGPPSPSYHCISPGPRHPAELQGRSQSSLLPASAAEAQGKREKASCCGETAQTPSHRGGPDCSVVIGVGNLPFSKPGCSCIPVL